MLVGGVTQFYAALRRKGLDKWEREPDAGGGRKGIKTANVPWLVYVACTGSGQFDSAMYVELQTRIDYNGLFDILECIEVHQSWANAQIANAKD